MKTKEITRMALLTAIALTIFMVELQLPGLSPVPGVKLGLAHIGDGVFELLTRSWLCGHDRLTVGRMHQDTINLVKATAQAKFADKMLPLLSEDEKALYRRGKNSHVHAVPKSTTPAEYAKATGVEALFGGLYLAGKTDRINEIFVTVMEELYGI